MTLQIEVDDNWAAHIMAWDMILSSRRQGAPFHPLSIIIFPIFRKKTWLYNEKNGPCIVDFPLSCLITRGSKTWIWYNLMMLFSFSSIFTTIIMIQDGKISFRPIPRWRHRSSGAPLPTAQEGPHRGPPQLPARPAAAEEEGRPGRLQGRRRGHPQPALLPEVLQGQRPEAEKDTEVLMICIKIHSYVYIYICVNIYIYIWKPSPSWVRRWQEEVGQLLKETVVVVCSLQIYSYSEWWICHSAIENDVSIFILLHHPI